ncbi:hypothetical protein, partial [Bartonella bovis]
NSQLIMKPHSKLVMPKFGSHLVLPLPQQDIAQNSSLGRAETTKQHLDNGRVPVFPKKISLINKHANAADSESIPQLNAKQQQEYLRRQRARGGSAKYRRYLTEPPLSYRQPAKIVPVGQSESRR